MSIENRVTAAQKDAKQRDLLIREYAGFIAASAAKVTKRFVRKEDDMYAVAMMAFDEAITKYQPEKGSFLSFAETVIRSRLTDEIRKEEGKNGRTVPFSSLKQIDKNGEETEFDPPGEADVVSDSVLEIQAVQGELERFGISFSDLPHCSPKSKKTRRECFALLAYIKTHPELISEIRQKGNLPAKVLQEQCGAGKKLLERHRRYLVTAVLIISGEYPILSQYIKVSEEV